MQSILINGKKWSLLKKRYSFLKKSFVYTIQDENGVKKDVTSLKNPTVASAIEKAAIIQGDKGDPGKDGHTPIPGVDFLTKKELDSIVNEIVTECMAMMPVPKDGDPGKDGVIPKAGIDYPTMAQVREWANREVNIIAKKLQPTQVKEIKTVVKEMGMTKEEIKDFIKENIPKKDLLSGGGGSFVGLAKVDTAGTPGTLQDKIIAGSNITITKTGDTLVVAGSAGGGSGTVETIVAGNNIDVDATDPANPIVSVETLTLADISDITASATEVNYTDGVTSAIQTQLDGKVNDTGDTMTGQLNIGAAGNALIARNTSDSASVQVAILEGDRTTMADADEAYISMKLSNDAGTQSEFARMTWIADDVNDGTGIDGSLVFSVVSAGVLNQELYLNQFFLFPALNDGLALGTSTNGFADLFLASGGVINFNNGDVALTHSADQLTLSGGSLSLNGNNLDNVSTYTAATSGVIRTRTSAGNTLLIKARDVDGAVDTTFITLTANNTPTCDLDDAVTKAGNYIYRAGGTDVPITDGGTGASTAAGAATNLGLGTGDSPQFTAVNVGHASDTTLSRSAAGTLAVEGVDVLTTSNTKTLTNKSIDADTNTITNIENADIKAAAAIAVNKLAALTASELVITDSSGFITTSTGVSATEAGYLNGVTSAIQTQLDARLPLAGGTMSGNITLGENTSIALDPAGSADGKYTGTTVTGTAGYAQTFGDLVYLDPTDSRWEKTDANAASGADGDARGVIGIVVVAGAADGNACTILLNGIIRADAAFPAMTINAPMYVSETAGAITGTVPTTTDAVMRTVGFALTADELRFDPSSDYATHT